MEKKIESRGITGKPSSAISSHGMKKLMKKGHQGVIAKLCSLDVQTSKYYISLDLQKVKIDHDSLEYFMEQRLSL